MNEQNGFVRVLKAFGAHYVQWIVLILMFVIFAIIAPDFLTPVNIINILNQNAYLIVCSLGVSLLMLSAQLDLSVGYQISLCGVCMGLFMKNAHAPWWAAILLGILVGVLLSSLNMGISIKLNIPLLLVTLATMMVFQGLSLQISGSKTINAFDADFKFISQGYIGPIPFAVILTLVLTVLLTIFMTKTYWGRYMYAVGGNTDAARLSGINVTSVRMLIGVLAGAFIGLSAVMYFARLGTAHPSYGPGTEITAMISIMVAGFSISGGSGRIPNVVAGVLIIGMLGNGMQLAGFGNNLQYIVKGIILLAAIGVDMYQQNRRAVVSKLALEAAAEEKTAA
jgi:ribose/xylose/arabinose/galactoside ABC-type transport system permease subunit